MLDFGQNVTRTYPAAMISVSVDANQEPHDHYYRGTHHAADPHSIDNTYCLSYCLSDNGTWSPTQVLNCRACLDELGTNRQQLSSSIWTTGMAHAGGMGTACGFPANYQPRLHRFLTLTGLLF
jgi:hypothetical protein